MPPGVPELALGCPSNDWRSQDSNPNMLVSRALNLENWETVSQDPLGGRVEGSRPLGPAGWLPLTVETHSPSSSCQAVASLCIRTPHTLLVFILPGVPS